MIKLKLKYFFIILYFIYIIVEMHYLFTNKVDQLTFSLPNELLIINISKIIFSFLIIFSWMNNNFKRLYTLSLIGIISTLIADIVLGFSFLNGSFLDAFEFVEVISLILLIKTSYNYRRSKSFKANTIKSLFVLLLFSFMWFALKDHYFYYEYF